jgi:acetate kinase
VHRVRKVVGAYLAVLGGADGLVFSGGNGENAPVLPAAVLAGLEPLGIALDPAANRRAVGREARLSSPSSPVDVRVVPADEAGELAREAMALLDGPADAAGARAGALPASDP